MTGVDWTICKWSKATALKFTAVSASVVSEPLGLMDIVVMLVVLNMTFSTEINVVCVPE